MTYRPSASLRADAGPSFAQPRWAAVRAAAQWERLGALALYLGLSALLFARPLGSRFASFSLGWGIDQAFFIWCLVWWPYAIARHLNPFITKLIFVPAGFNLTWSTSIPLVSLLAAPLTLTLGPIATFNLLCVVMPALTAWSAFVLCRYVTGKFWPAMLGGYIFGFSSYMLAHILGGHINLFAAFLPPLAVYLVLERLEERMGARTFTLAMFGLLSAQFLIAPEILATMTLFGAIALAMALALGPRALEWRIVALARPLFLAYLGMALLVSPYLYYLFADFRTASIYSPSWHSTDLLNFVVPSATVWLGDAVSLFRNVCASFTSNISEQGAYVGAPLLAIALWFAVARRRGLDGRLLAAMLVVTAVMSMGPRFHVAGRSSFKLPWSLFHRTPLLDQALPIRTAMYSFLLLAVIAAIWMSTVRMPRWIRAGAALLVIVSLLPNPSALFWVPNTAAAPPGFFTRAIYRRYLAPGEVVATLPYAWDGADICMLWQALSGMYFRLAGGYPPLSPADYTHWPIIRSANERAWIADPVDQWKAFAADHGVTAVIRLDMMPPADLPSVAAIVAALGPPAVRAGGIALYRVRPETLAPYRGVTWARMEELEDEQRLSALLLAAHQYLASGADPAALSPERAAKMGLLPQKWLLKIPYTIDYWIELRTEPGGLVSIGIMGTYAALRPLMDRYGADAREVYFPSPFPLGRISPPTGSVYYHKLVITFDRNGLDRAAALALKEQPRLEPSLSWFARTSHATSSDRKGLEDAAAAAARRHNADGSGAQAPARGGGM